MKKGKIRKVGEERGCSMVDGRWSMAGGKLLIQGCLLISLPGLGKEIRTQRGGSGEKVPNSTGFMRFTRRFDESRTILFGYVDEDFL